MVDTRSGSTRGTSTNRQDAEKTPTPTPDRRPPSTEAGDILREVALEEQKLKLLELRARTLQAEQEVRRLEASAREDGAESPILGQDRTSTGASLPKGREPPVFDGKSRANYDDWSRSLERQFRRHNGFARREDRIVDHASEYMGKLQQDHWERYVDQMGEEQPTWAIMKRVMLDSMGSEAERRQRAHDKLKTVTQGNRNPQELLEELKVLWQEVKEDREDQKILGFTSALTTGLRYRLSLHPTQATSLQEAEERANLAFRLEHKGQERDNGRYTTRKRQATALGGSPPYNKV